MRGSGMGEEWNINASGAAEIDEKRKQTFSKT